MKTFIAQTREKLRQTIWQRGSASDAPIPPGKASTADATPAGASITFPDISHVLHDSRSAFLRAMPRVLGTILSAGCAGTWYFHWVASRTGHAARHIGIEFYSDKPDDLPTNVDWIANTVGNMSGVADGECELVFSGENLEHLWPEDVIGFFLESWRVLRPGGFLVVDSPNRNVTEPLVWSHPEHTIEFTPDEARRLAVLSGFEVNCMKGIWICKDPDTADVLPLDPNATAVNWPTIERCAAASVNPDSSLIWWMEASKSGVPNPEELKREVDAIFAKAWPERSRRFLSIVGKRTSDRKGFEVGKGTGGVLIYGPYMPLKAGQHSATFTMKASGQTTSGEIVARVDIIGLQGQELAVREISGNDLASGNGSIQLHIDLSSLEFGIQARCISTGAADLHCDLPVIV